MGFSCTDSPNLRRDLLGKSMNYEVSNDFGARVFPNPTLLSVIVPKKSSVPARSQRVYLLLSGKRKYALLSELF